MTTRCYAWPLTVQDGSDLHLHVSTGYPRFGVRLLRCGAGVTAADSPPGSYAGQPVPLGRPDEAWGWPSHRIPLPASLADGIYLAVPVPLGAAGELWWKCRISALISLVPVLPMSEKSGER